MKGQSGNGEAWSRDTINNNVTVFKVANHDLSGVIVEMNYTIMNSVFSRIMQ